MTDAPTTQPEHVVGPLWRQALDKALREMGTKQRVADFLGISRPYVSRVMSGDIHRVSQIFIDRVIDRLGVLVVCPHTYQLQPQSDCRHALGAAPTHNPFRLALWQACQTCPHKPDPKPEPKKES